jgi:hypothetical protein
MDEMNRKVTPKVDAQTTVTRRIDVVSGSTTADHPVSKRDHEVILDALRDALRAAKRRPKD